MKILLPLLALVSSLSAFAKDHYIQVQGRCQTKVTPDRVMLTLTPENQSRNQKEAFAKTTQQMEKLKAEIQKMNLEKLELKTSGFNVFPVREYEKDKIVDKGMRVSMSLDVITSQIERIGEVLVASNAIGISNVGSLQTFLSLEKSRDEYLKCLDIASDDAKAKAKQLAKKLKVDLDDVIRVIETPPTPPGPVFQGAMLKSSLGGEAMDAPRIEPGQQEFSTTIEVSFGIK